MNCFRLPRLFSSLIVLIAIYFQTSQAGFCDHKFDGWHCDYDIAKHCVDDSKVSEIVCSFDCRNGRCREPELCELRKTPYFQELSFCRGVIAYTVDDKTNVVVTDSNAKSLSELVASYAPPPQATTSASAVVNGTTNAPDPITPHPAEGVDCPTAYKRYACFREFYNCEDRTHRRSCNTECGKVNLCNTNGNQIDCPFECNSGSALRYTLMLVVVLVVVSTLI